MKESTNNHSTRAELLTEVAHVFQQGLGYGVLFLSYAFGEGPSWMLSILIRTCWMPTRPFDLVRRQIGPPRLVLKDHVEPCIKVLSPCPLGV